MQTMVRETWTDERLDDLNKKVDDGFAAVDKRFDKVDARFDKIDARLIEMYRVLVGAAVVVIATLLGAI